MIIKHKKGQTLLYAVCTLAATALFLSFWIVDFREFPHERSLLLDNAVAFWSFRVLALLGLFFTIAGGIYLFKQLFSKEALITVCDEFFCDQSSAIAFGKIVWEEIEGASLKGKFLSIKLKNPQPYIQKKNLLQRLMIKGNHKLGYGDVVIASERFKKDWERFLEEFNKRKPIAFYTQTPKEENTKGENNDRP